MSVQSKRTQRQKLKAQGLVPMEIWVLPEHKQAMKDTEMACRTPSEDVEFCIKCKEIDCIMSENGITCVQFNKVI